MLFFNENFRINHEHIMKFLMIEFNLTFLTFNQNKNQSDKQFMKKSNFQYERLWQFYKLALMILTSYS